MARLLSAACESSRSPPRVRYDAFERPGFDRAARRWLIGQFTWKVIDTDTFDPPAW